MVHSILMTLVLASRVRAKRLALIEITYVTSVLISNTGDSGEGLGEAPDAKRVFCL